MNQIHNLTPEDRIDILCDHGFIFVFDKSYYVKAWLNEDWFVVGKNITHDHINRLSDRDFEKRVKKADYHHRRNYERVHRLLLKQL